MATSEKVIGREHFCLPSKIFDAVSSGKRILAFVTRGVQYDFLREYNQVAFFNPDEIEANVTKFQEILNGNFNEFKINKLSKVQKRKSIIKITAIFKSK